MPGGCLDFRINARKAKEYARKHKNLLRSLCALKGAPAVSFECQVLYDKRIATLSHTKRKGKGNPDWRSIWADANAVLLKAMESRIDTIRASRRRDALNVLPGSSGAHMSDHDKKPVSVRQIFTKSDHAPIQDKVRQHQPKEVATQQNRHVQAGADVGNTVSSALDPAVHQGPDLGRLYFPRMEPRFFAKIMHGPPPTEVGFDEDPFLSKTPAKSAEKPLPERMNKNAGKSESRDMGNRGWLRRRRRRPVVRYSRVKWAPPQLIPVKTTVNRSQAANKPISRKTTVPESKTAFRRDISRADKRRESDAHEGRTRASRSDSWRRSSFRLRYIARTFTLRENAVRAVSLPQESRYTLRHHEYIARKQRMRRARRSFEEELDRVAVWSALKGVPVGGASFLPAKVQPQQVEESQAQDLLHNVRAYLEPGVGADESQGGHRDRGHQRFKS